MLNSSARGGGVAEMLPKVVSILRELGVDVHWYVMSSEQPGYFQLTKRLHNLIHGHGDPTLGPEEQQLYESVSREVADELCKLLSPNDVLVAGCVVVFALSIESLGLVPAVALTSFLLSIADRHVELVSAFIVALVLALFSWLVFTVALSMSWPAFGYLFH
jgi:hypothetical protein